MKSPSGNLPLFAFIVLALSSVAAAQVQATLPVPDDDMKLTDFEDLEYPRAASQARIQGLVVLRARLDDQGKVVDVEALSGSKLLVPASVENLKKWRFLPNQQKSALVVYNFRVTDAQSKSGCSRFAVQPPNFATITVCPNPIQ